ncbi:phosphotransferase family protein [Yimella sp. cx-51]|uniref:phosphotransferase family protein n=1 Tax=Yimella sp. cx-51 TaxID=2770551 RepID=UPI00165E97B9|nr:aminoglycoside phosphotransferase family protein [Yimella sp. cx-51]MBC9957536.1 aminoglycoside phosphotransferase family protein [Yimella sp. cx-51]QTH39238.1 aminoglycoside phosphotransferase family protein [Yimella sp. cx-51]
MLPRRDIEPRALLTQLAPDLADASLRELGEGFDNVAYLVGDDMVLRISKHSDLSERQHVAARDGEILTLANRFSTLPTSEVLAIDVAQGALLLTHVAGRALSHVLRTDEPHWDGARLASLDRGSFTAQMAGFLTSLWSASPDELRGHVPMPPVSAAQWLAQTTIAYQQMRCPLAVEDRRRIESFLGSPVLGDDTWEVFSHNDLGEDHIFVDADGTASGVIDWSDAVIGDPARDLALLMLDLGPTIAMDVVDQLGAHRFGDLTSRARWWAARSGVEGVAWRAANRPDTVEAALTKLRAVFDV